MTSILQATGGAIVLGSLLLWIWTLARIFAGYRFYIVEDPAPEVSEQVRASRDQDLAIAGLVFAGLAIGQPAGAAAALLIGAFGAFIFSWSLSWRPGRVSAMGGAGLAWSGALCLLLAVLIYAATVGVFAEAAMVVALAAVAIASARNALAYPRSAKRMAVVARQAGEEATLGTPTVAPTPTQSDPRSDPGGASPTAV